METGSNVRSVPRTARVEHYWHDMLGTFLDYYVSNNFGWVNSYFLPNQYQLASLIVPRLGHH